MTKTGVIDLLRDLRDGNKKDRKNKDNEIIKDYLQGRIEVFQTAIRLTKLIRLRR